jgi:lipoic acid synthetase
LHQSDRTSYINKRRLHAKVSVDDLKKVHKVKKILRENKIDSVCEKAKCPNITECFSKQTATFIILGKVCTRNCAFCAVKSSSPGQIDVNEPYNVAKAVRHLKLKHVVITSVTRDDLEDKGISQFAKTVREIKRLTPKACVEVLTPDFKGRQDSVEELLDDNIQIFGHNVEMVKRLYPALRKGSCYDRSLGLLKKVKASSPGIKTKSAVMLGLGEKKEEVVELLQDIKQTRCDIIVIGQYLQPTLKNVVVKKYVTNKEFKYYEKLSYSLGFSKVYSFPKARSSYYP